LQAIFWVYPTKPRERNPGLKESHLFDQTKSALKEGLLNEAYGFAITFIDAQIQGPKLAKLNTEVLQVMASLTKALSLSGNIKYSDDLLSRCLSQIDPKDDHLFLGLSEELVYQSQFNAIAGRDNESLYDKLIDQALRIREALVGPDSTGAELVIEAVLNNLTRARANANTGLTAKAAARLSRCRTLMDELNRIMMDIKRPSPLLNARVNTLRSFFAQSAGQKNKAKEFYLDALNNFSLASQHGTLEKNEIFDMFTEQSQLFQLSIDEKKTLEKIKRAKLAARREPTIHQIKAFPTTEQIQEVIHRAQNTPGKTFYLTSLGFLGAYNLLVAMTADRLNGNLTVKIDQSQIDGSFKKEPVILNTDNAVLILTKIKELWKALQNRPSTVLRANNNAMPFESSTNHNAVITNPNQGPLHKEEFDFQKPVGITHLFGQDSDDDFTSTHSKANNDGFEGNLKSLPAFGLLQTISLSENSGILEISTNSGNLTISFLKGRPTHAQSTKYEGMDALYEFVLQEDGWFRFNPGTPNTQSTLKVNVPAFMMEAAALFDEMKYLRSLGMTQFSGIFTKESINDRQHLNTILKERHVEPLDSICQLYESIEERPILMEAIEEAGLSLAQWTHALYQLVQCGLVSISNESLDADIFAHKISTNWTFDKKRVERFANSLIDTRTLLYKFEFFVFMLEKEFERARTHNWPLAIAVFEIRKLDRSYTNLTAEEKETVMMVMAELSDAKRPIDWLCHFEEEQFAIIMPGLDTNLATMFVRTFLQVLGRSIGRLKDDNHAWDYSFGIASVPQDTIQWQKMVGFATEAQREAKIKRAGFSSHSQAQAAEETAH
jgi:GGDEF domain-containing protein